MTKTYRRLRLAPDLYAVVRRDGSEAGRVGWCQPGWRGRSGEEWLPVRDQLAAAVVDVATADRQAERGGMER